MEPDSAWKVEGGGHSRGLGAGAKRMCVSWALCTNTPCGFPPTPGPLRCSLSPGAGRLPPCTPGRRGWPPGRAALPAWTSLGPLSAQQGLKNGPLPGSWARGPWSCCQVWAGLGGCQEQRKMSGWARHPQLPQHAHTHSLTHASRAWRMQVIPRTMALLTSLWAVQPPCPHPTPCHHLPCLHS